MNEFNITDQLSVWVLFHNSINPQTPSVSVCSTSAVVGYPHVITTDTDTDHPGCSSRLSVWKTLWWSSCSFSQCWLNTRERIFILSIKQVTRDSKTLNSWNAIWHSSICVSVSVCLCLSVYMYACVCVCVCVCLCAINSINKCNFVVKNTTITTSTSVCVYVLQVITNK